MMAQNVLSRYCSTHPTSASVEKKWIIELRNGKIFVRLNLSDILKSPPRDDVVEADGGAFIGGNGILHKEVPARVANITSHNQMTKNHTQISTQVHI